MVNDLVSLTLTYMLVAHSIMSCATIRFSAPEPKALSVVVNFSNFRLPLFNHWTEFNQNWQEEVLKVLYHICIFSGNRKTKMAALTSDCPRHFCLLWNCWMEFNETWLEARYHHPRPNLCFSGRLEIQGGRAASDLPIHFWLLLWNRRMEFNETWQEASTSSTKS